jgi:thiamine-phosphate pyrophosphorylase
VVRQLHRGIYLITEHERLAFADVFAITRSVIGSISALQYRNKSTDDKQKRAQASELQKLCKDHQVPFIINDNIDLAIELDTDGVHLGREDTGCREARHRLGQNKLIGVSCYNEILRADQAVADGASYIAFGAMFPTRTKTNTVPANTGLIQQAKQRYTVPVVAIGGITTANCGAVINAGTDLLAVVSSVYLAQNPVAVIHTFNQLMTKT